MGGGFRHDEAAEDAELGDACASRVEPLVALEGLVEGENVEGRLAATGEPFVERDADAVGTAPGGLSLPGMVHQRLVDQACGDAEDGVARLVDQAEGNGQRMRSRWSGKGRSVDLPPPFVVTIVSVQKRAGQRQSAAHPLRELPHALVGILAQADLFEQGVRRFRVPSGAPARATWSEAPSGYQTHSPLPS